MIGASGLCPARSASEAPHADRFVWLFGWNLRSDRDVDEMTRVLERAAEAGLNGAVLSAGLDSLCKKSPEYFERLERLDGACRELGMDLIPSVFSVGYGGGVLSHDRNLAEGLPVKDALFVAGETEARFTPSARLEWKNGGFEEFEGHRLAGFNFHDQPGRVSFVDTNVFHGGKASLRLENFGEDPHGHGRVMQEVRVDPWRCYRVTLWIKTEDFGPSDSFRLQALVGNRQLAPRSFATPPASDWRKLTTLFNSGEHTSIRLYAGLWQGKTGKVWLDDWSVEEAGPINALGRPGTPVTVRSEESGREYAAGRDFAPLTDPEFNFYRIDRAPPVLRLLPNGRIPPGERLRVSWFHPMVINDSQVTICMAEPALDAIWDHEARLLADRLKPKRILLNMDEVRMGGTCDACRGKDMARLLGDCVTRQVEALRRYNPGAAIYIWSDMLDPNHNARGDYYLVNGSFEGTWRFVPQDLKIAVWGGRPRPESLRFFSKQGFEVLIACYYDADDLTDVEGWLRAATPFENVRGFMYTPWQRKYELLPEFGALLRP